MTPHSENPAPEALLAQQDFVRGLVRSLHQGGEGEDDLVQSTWLRVLRQPPGDPGRARPWLARIARNLLRDHARENRRRSSASPTKPRKSILYGSLISGEQGQIAAAGKVADSRPGPVNSSKMSRSLAAAVTFSWTA